MELKKYIDKIMLSKEKTKHISIIGMVGILLIATSTIIPKNLGEKNESSTLNNNSITTEAYITQLEKKINAMISNIEGVGSSEVVITLENGIENVYANSEKKISDCNANISGKSINRNDIQHDVVIVDGSRGKQALVITQKEPTVKGVVVVCEGADSSVIVKRVTDAITKALNIKTNRISVVKKQQTKNK